MYENCDNTETRNRTKYVYDADGNRVAKGTITQFTCDLNPADPTYNGLTAAGNETDYILGPSGEQVTELAQDANGSYILLIAIAEIMTIGLAYQVWLHLRSQKRRQTSE